MKDRQKEKVIFARGDFVFMVVAIALLGGFLIPVSTQILDVLWIFVLCTYFGLLVITIAAKEAGELKVFPAILVTATVVKLFTATSTVRSVFLDTYGGRIIDIVGEAIAGGNALLPIVILPFGSVVIFIIIHNCTKKISVASRKFLNDIMPLKRICIESDLNAGVIDAEQAADIEDKIDDEANFYRNINAGSKLVSCDGAISALIVIVMILGSAAMATVSSLSSEGSVRDYAALSTGAGVLILLPPLVVIISTALMAGRSSLTLGREAERARENVRKSVEVIKNENGTEETVEVLNPDFAKVAAKYQLDAAEKPIDVEINYEQEEQSEFDKLLNQTDNSRNILEAGDEERTDTIAERPEDEQERPEAEQTEPEDEQVWAEEEQAEPVVEDETVVEEAVVEAEVKEQEAPEEEKEEPIEEKQQQLAEQDEQEKQEEKEEEDVFANIIPIGHRYPNREAYFDEINSIVLGLKPEQKPIVFASESIEDLPVTSVVNPAVAAVKQEQKVVIVDMDASRNAVVKVFDIDPSKKETGPAETFIENISVYMDPELEGRNAEEFEQIIERLCGEFDNVIIYAPNFGSLNSESLCCAAKSGIVFTSKYVDDDTVYQVMGESKCSIKAVMLGPEKAIAG